MFDSLLPPNATELERDLEGATQRVGTVPVENIRALWNPDLCPVSLLPWLAWALNIDDWDPGWSVEDKRNSIRESYSVHSHKGTPGAIKRALKAAGYGDVSITEGLDADMYNGSINHDGLFFYGTAENWARYRVFVNVAISVAQSNQIRDILKNVQAARSELAELNFAQASNLYDSTIQYDGVFTHGTV